MRVLLGLIGLAGALALSMGLAGLVLELIRAGLPHAAVFTSVEPCIVTQVLCFGMGLPAVCGVSVVVESVPPRQMCARVFWAQTSNLYNVLLPNCSVYGDTVVVLGTEPLSAWQERTQRSRSQLAVIAIVLQSIGCCLALAAVGLCALGLLGVQRRAVREQELHWRRQTTMLAAISKQQVDSCYLGRLDRDTLQTVFDHMEVHSL